MLRLSMLLSTLLLAACSSAAVSGLSLQVPTPTHLSAPTQALIATAAAKLKAAECLSQPEAAAMLEALIALRTDRENLRSLSTALAR